LVTVLTRADAAPDRVEAGAPAGVDDAGATPGGGSVVAAAAGLAAAMPHTSQ
jgi:hypothetical protein